MASTSCRTLWISSVDSGRTIDALRLDGWRVDVGYPEDRDRAEELLAGEAVAGEAEAADD